MADELDNTIRENAAGPKRARGDSGEMEQHSLKDQIEADKYLADKEAMTRKLAKVFALVAARKNLIFERFTPPVFPHVLHAQCIGRPGYPPI